MKVVLLRVVMCVLINSRWLTADTQSRTAVSPIFPLALLPTDEFTTLSTNNNCTELDPPEVVEISIGKTAANITWSIHQHDSNCVPTEIIVICIADPAENQYGSNWVTNNTATNGVDSGTDNKLVTVENLTEFTNYTCIGSLFTSEGNSAMTNVTLQTEKEVSGPPLNLVIGDITNHSFSITWEPPEKNPGVFENYQLHIESNTPNHYIPSPCGVPNKIDRWINVSDETYMFYDGAPDYIYEVTVFLVNDVGNGASATTNVTTLTSPSQEPRNFQIDTELLDEESNAISINLSWQMPCNTNGPISLFEIIVNGYYMLNDSFTDIRYFSAIANDTEGYSKKIYNLMPASNYTISISANGETENGIFAESLLITEDNWPGSPIIKNITNRKSNSFTVSWDEPERRAGNITNYELTIISGSPIYVVNPDRCKLANETLNITLEGDTRTYSITGRSPYYTYNISIRAFTSRGSGKSSFVTAETMPSEPAKPENVSFSLKEDPMTGNISWVTPCNVNGPVQDFMIKLRWFYSVDHSLTGEDTLSISYRRDIESYYHNINLVGSHNYEATVWIVLTDGTAGSGVQINITTPDGYPGAPNITGITELAENSFTVSWEPPSTKTGRITDYQIIIASLGPLYPTKCPINNEVYTYNMASGSLTTYNFKEGQPYYNYSILISASTSVGFGSASEKAFTNTMPAVPESVVFVNTLISHATEEEYNAYLNMSFEAPCRLNGKLRYYQLNMLGIRTNYTDDPKTLNCSSTSFTNVRLNPEYTYTFYIETVNELYINKTGSSTFTSPAGVPLFSNTLENFNITTKTYTAAFTLKKDYFDAKNGDIRYVALIISDQNTSGGDFQSWDGEVWPLPSSPDTGEYYQITEDKWYPFIESNEVLVNIGENTKCTDSQKHCNKPLENDKDYYLIIRIFTTKFYKDSPAIHFRTDDLSKLGTILGTIFGLLAFALIATAAFIVWQKKIIEMPLIHPRKSSTKSATNINTAVPSYKFLQYYKTLENNPEKLSEQYALLAEKTKEAVRMQTCMYAALTENRRKNRYTNILPYDDTRVKLLIDEDDEIGSDYINASYIRGYSGNVEYIAMQGPLPTTCRDFWKMVVQEKVSIIVMVTQFIEQNKEKCYKYFPNNHESMAIGEDMEVKCTMELHFGTYCVRTLQVKKDTLQVTVTHMQYLDWPDFNVPSGTETMLQFCCQMRDRLEMEGGYVIVHCSAGVGRTGTLIATDILLQTINAGKHIDVFNTVLELRKQRTNMVQTQKQYMYIHNLIKDSIDQFQTSGMIDNAEAIHETTSALKIKSDDDNLINKEKESESQF